MRVYSLTSFKDKRFKKGTSLFVSDPSSGLKETVTIDSYRDAGDFVFLHFKEWKTIEEAEKRLHHTIEIEEKDAPLPKGYYRLSDLVGCSIIDDEGKKLGTVTEVSGVAVTKNLRVKRENGKDFFVPFLMGEFIKTIDIEKKEIRIHVIPGLLG